MLCSVTFNGERAQLTNRYSTGEASYSTFTQLSVKKSQERCKRSFCSRHQEVSSCSSWNIHMMYGSEVNEHTDVSRCLWRRQMLAATPVTLHCSVSGHSPHPIFLTGSREAQTSAVCAQYTASVFPADESSHPVVNDCNHKAFKNKRYGSFQNLKYD